jgi:hypothetical protein
MTVPNTTPINSIKQPKYSLDIEHQLHKTYLTMNFHDSRVLSSSFPATYEVLEQSLPSIFACKCFNDAGRPFKEEVMDTEIAHLFEHIVLEYLCKNKLAAGADNASFRGETSWNWHIDPRGTFYIWINAGFADTFSFNQACQEAIMLFNQILD